MKVYVVKAPYGEYEDYYEPIIGIFTDEAKADEVIAKRNAAIAENDRKRKHCKDEKDGLKALSSIIGIDIMADNVLESRLRLMNMYGEAFPHASKEALMLAADILVNNIICGDSLKIMKEWERYND